MNWRALKIVPSDRKHKKLKVRVDGTWVHFGDKRYEDFTQHRDASRRRRYLARATKIRDGQGRFTVDDPRSPNFWSVRVLWDGP